MDQLRIYQNWGLEGKEDSLKDVHGKNVQVISDIFDAFAQVEALAVKFIQTTPVYRKNTNCYEMAYAINKLKASQLKPDAVAQFSLANDFFRNSRKGFMCSLCNKKNHRFFKNRPLYDQETSNSYGFCYEMVNKTLGYFHFETNELLKIIRLNTIFVDRCDHLGNYTEQNIPEVINLKKQPQFSDSIEKCVSA